MSAIRECILPFDYLGKIKIQCDGNGVCDNTTTTVYENAVYNFKCLCIPGWVGRSDWIDTTGIDCQINYLAIRILWAVNMFIVLVVLLRIIHLSRFVRQKYLELAAQKRSKGMDYHIYDNKGYFTTLVVLFVWAPSHIILGIVKLYDPSMRVAIDVLPTVFWYLSRTGFYLSAQIFQPSLLQNLLKGTKEAEHLVKTNYIITWSMTIGMVLIPFICLPVMATQGRNLYISSICVAIFFAGQSIILLFYVFNAFKTKTKIGNILQKSYEVSHDTKTLDIKHNLENIQKEVMRQAFIQGCLYGAFAIVPYMWNKHDYILPLSHITIPIVCLRTITAVSGTKTSESNRRETNMQGPSTDKPSTRGSVPDGKKDVGVQATIPEEKNEEKVAIIKMDAVVTPEN